MSKEKQQDSPIVCKGLWKIFGANPTNILKEVDPTWSRAEVQEKTEGGIHLPEERISKERVATMVGNVVKMCGACYKNKITTPSDVVDPKYAD